jgi:hypothetical protein
MQGSVRAVLAAVLVLSLTACSGSSGSDVLLSAGGMGDSSFLLTAERDPLALELTRPGTHEDDDERVEGYDDDPSLDEATAFHVVDEAQDMTIVAGPVADGTTRVLVRSGVSSSEASVVAVGDTLLFVARLVGHVDYDSITAFGDDGEPLDVTAPQSSPHAPAGTVQVPPREELP